MKTPDVERVYKHIGRTVRKARKDKGLVQDDVAEALDWTRPSVTNLEKGRQRVMLHDLPKLARVVGIRVIDLIPPEWKR